MHKALGLIPSIEEEKKKKKKEKASSRFPSISPITVSVGMSLAVLRA
jgi:hypothetical protein